jgi:hypothetical protein
MTPQSYDLVTVTGARCQLRNLKISANATAVGDYQGLALRGANVKDFVMDTVQIEKASRFNMMVEDVTSMTAIDCEFQLAFDSGLFVTRSGTTPWRLGFIGCAFYNNTQNGAQIGPSSTVDSGDSVTLFGCEFVPRVLGLSVVACQQVQLLGCYFESSALTTPGGLFAYVADAKGIVIDGCFFSGHNQVARAVDIVNSPFARFTSNIGIELNLGFASLGIGTTDAVEFANFELNIPPRVDLLGARSFGLSRGAIQMQRHAVLPSAQGLQDGCLVWLDSDDRPYLLRNGVWRQIAFA